MVYAIAVAWTLRVRVLHGISADSQSPRYTYTNPEAALERALSNRLKAWFRAWPSKNRLRNGYGLFCATLPDCLLKILFCLP